MQLVKGFRQRLAATFGRSPDNYWVVGWTADLNYSSRRLSMRRRELLFLVGGAVTASHALRAEQKAMPVIGFLNSEGVGVLAARLAALRQGLSETGYVEGQNVAIEYRWAEGHYDRLPALAADLVGRSM